MDQTSEKALSMNGNFSKDPLLYNVSMIKIWSTLINLKFGNVDEELSYYLDNIDETISKIKEQILELLLEKPQELTN
jgi:hypothetical protein